MSAIPKDRMVISDEIKKHGLYGTIIKYCPYIHPVVMKLIEDKKYPTRSAVSVLLSDYIIMKQKYSKKDLAEFFQCKEYYDVIYVFMVMWIRDNEELLQMRML